MNNFSFAEYVWIDGAKPTQHIRSKTRTVSVSDNPVVREFPLWGFDGSSTGQADSSDADCLLTPVRVYKDPFRSEGDFIVLCEVHDGGGNTHVSNHRSQMRNVIRIAGDDVEPWLGFEQGYTLFKNGHPLGFPENAFPEPQGLYYCAVGSEKIHGRELVEAHAKACITAGVLFHGIHADVMPGQWEFQIGYRGIEGERCDALSVADDVWIARYLLNRIGELHSVHISFDNKPVKGDWTGVGMHTTFSTAYTRDPRCGLGAINTIVDVLEARHDEHIAEYGDGLVEHLTGEHETSRFDTFNSGVAHCGASIRIPQTVALHGYGFLEDRRPGANSDPYRVGTCLINAVIGNSEKKTRPQVT